MNDFTRRAEGRVVAIARRSGACPDCGERWQPGQLIRSDFEIPGHYPTWTHAACPESVIYNQSARKDRP